MFDRQVDALGKQKKKFGWGDPPPLEGSGRVVRVPDVTPTGGEPDEAVPSMLLDSMDPEELQADLLAMIERGPTDADLLRVNRLLLHREPRVRALALEVLRAGGTIATEAIRASLADPMDEVRAAAIRVAGTDPAGLADVMHFVGAREWPRAQAAALDVLPSLMRRGVEFSDNEVTTLLLLIARAPSPPLERERGPFGEIARVIGMATLMRALEYSDRRRVGAARLLIAEGSALALLALADHRDDENEEVRALAATAIERDGSSALPGAIPERETRAAEPDESAPREEQADAGLGVERERIRSLAKALLSPDDAVREDAMRTLGEPGWGAVLVWVREALREGSDEDAALAASASERLMLSAMAAPILERAALLPVEDRGAFVRALASFELDASRLVGLTAELDPLARPAGMTILWEIGGRPILAQLASHADDLSRDERVAILGVLRDAQDPEAFALSERFLLEDPSAAVREAAVSGLALGSPERRLQSLQTALGDPNANVRAAAVELLARGAGPDAAPSLLTALADPDERVSVSAARHLAWLAESDPVSVWAGLKRARGAAERALRESLEREHAGVLGRLRVEHLDAVDPRDRVLAIELGSPGRDISVATLDSALDDPDPGVRLAATRSLSSGVGPAAMPSLARSLADPSPGIRLLAIEALGEQDERASLDHLVPMLGDPDAGVVAAAARVLGAKRSWALARRLVEALSTPALRDGARALLLDMGSFVVGLLIDGLSDRDPEVRSLVGELLWEIEGLDEFARWLNSTDGDRRGAAIEAIAAIGGEDAVDLLIRALGDPEDTLRIRALRGLATIGNDRAVPAVRACAETDPVREVVEEARRTLSKLQTASRLTDSPPFGG